MGATCKKCLKDERENEGEVLKSRIVPEGRITKYIQTGFFAMNTLFFVSNEPIAKFKFDCLLVFSDSLQRVLYNKFFQEMSPLALSDIQCRVEMLKGKAQFSKPGHKVNIYEPSPNLSFKNLLICCVKVNNGIEQSIESSIGTIFDQMASNQSVVSLGILEISEGLGYNSNEFQKLIIKKLWKISKKKREVTVFYYTYSHEKIDSFINEIMALNPQSSASNATPRINTSNDSSSNYF